MKKELHDMLKDLNVNDKDGTLAIINAMVTGMERNIANKNVVIVLMMCDPITGAVVLESNIQSPSQLAALMHETTGGMVRDQLGCIIDMEQGAKARKN